MAMTESRQRAMSANKESKKPSNMMGRKNSSLAYAASLKHTR